VKARSNGVSAARRVEPMQAKAHGVGGFAVRPATLFSICVW
jgi:hypothetical protein